MTVEMFLPEVQQRTNDSPWSNAVRMMGAAGLPVPQIMHLFAFKPDWTEHLARFTQAVMRAPSPLQPGERELIAAFTSRVNSCDF